MHSTIQRGVWKINFMGTLCEFGLPVGISTKTQIARFCGEFTAIRNIIAGSQVAPPAGMIVPTTFLAVLDKSDAQVWPPDGKAAWPSRMPVVCRMQARERCLKLD